MANVLEGDLLAHDLKLAIVVSRFNGFITEKLLAGALDTIGRSGGERESVTVAWVPGSFELPVVAKKLAESGEYDAVICLGCIIRGSTAHYDCVVEAATHGVSRVGLETGVPVIFGVLTCETIEQAIERAGTKLGNSGAKAAGSAIEMANLLRKL